MECSRPFIERYCEAGPRLGQQSAKIKELAKKCNVGYYGVKPTGVLQYAKRDERTCARIISQKPEKLDYVSVETQFGEFLDAVVHLDRSGESLYRGYVESALYGMLYLLRRNKNECMVYSNPSVLAQRIMRQPDIQIEDLSELDWSDVGLVWSWDRGNKFKLTLPGGSREAYMAGLRRCLSEKSTRFVLNVITIVTEDKVCHANILLYDRNTHILERFEPYQAVPPGMHTAGLDIALQQIFRAVDPDYQEFVGPPDLDFFLQHGLQLQQEAEGEVSRVLDPVGFCQPWVFLYADTRMAFPDMLPEMIPELFKSWVAQKEVSLTEFIRNFANHLYQTSRTVYQHYLDKEEKYQRFRDPEIALLAISLDQLSIYQTVMTGPDAVT